MTQDVDAPAAPDAAAVRTVTSTDGTVIAYESIGSGPALVLVDGALGYRDFGPCRSLAKHLSGRFTVYLYDRRGRGASGDTQPYSPEREFEDLAAVIEAAGGDASVLGFSSGGALVLQAAAAGVMIRKVAVYEPPYTGIRAKKGRLPDHLDELTARLATGDRGGAVGYFMVDMVGAPAIMPIMLRLRPKVFTQLKGVAHTLPYDARVMGNFRAPTATLARITAPTLVIHGSKAPPAMVTGVTEAADAIPDAQQVTLARQTHQVKDAAIAPELIRFFA